MESIIRSFQQEFQRLVDASPKLLAALVAVVLFTLLGRLAGKAVVRTLERGKLTATHRSFFQGLTRWGFTLFGVLIGLNILGYQGLAASLLASGGFLAVALGFSFRQVGENLLSGLFLAFNRPFEMKDLIQSGDLVGIVEGIELRNTHVRTFDGRDIYIPSSQIFNQPLINFTRDGLRRPSFTVGIDFSQNLKDVADLLAETVSGMEDVLSDPPVEVNVSQFLASCAELEVTFWIDAFKASRNFFQIRTQAMRSCHAALMEKGVKISSDAITNIALVGSAAPGTDTGLEN